MGLSIAKCIYFSNKKLLALFYIRAGHHKNTLLISSSFFNTKRYKHFKSMRTAILCVERKRSTNCLTSKSFKSISNLKNCILKVKQLYPTAYIEMLDDGWMQPKKGKHML